MHLGKSIFPACVCMFLKNPKKDTHKKKRNKHLNQIHIYKHNNDEL